MHQLQRIICQQDNALRVVLNHFCPSGSGSQVAAAKVVLVVVGWLTG
jgi:hypothetical protein